MQLKRVILITGVGASLAVGGAAVAASQDDRGRKTEDAVLSDAAKRLDVSSDELRDALRAAQDTQLEEAVKNGDLTRKQADAIKARRNESGRVLGPPVPSGPGFHGPPGGPGPHGGPGGPRHGGLLEAVAKALGISREDLFSELREGKSLEDIAKGHDKSLDEVKNAVKTEVERNLDEAVKNGDLTRRQADEMKRRLPEKLDRLGQGGPFGHGPPPFGPGGGPPGGGPPPPPPPGG